jgi:hypothetical protein
MGFVRAGVACILILGVFQHVAHCADCVAQADANSNWDISDCDWTSSLYLNPSSAGTVKLLQVKVENLGKSDTDVSFIDLNGFDHAFFDECTFSYVSGKSGALMFRSSSASDVWFRHCSVNFAHFTSAGFLSTGSTQGPLIYVQNSLFQNHFISAGGGVLNGASGHWHISQTEFLNCTNSPKETTADSGLNGAVLKLNLNSAGQEVIIRFEGCTLKNPSESTWYECCESITVVCPSSNPN